MKVTIKDVAKKAGVATSTVSRTLKDSSSISEITKNKVRKAMEELGYVPNVQAQTLALKASRNIGLILPPSKDNSHQKQPFFMDIISEISQALNELQYTAALVSGKSEEELLNRVDRMYKQSLVDGFIVLYSLEGDMVVDYLWEQKIPFVMVGKPFNNSLAIRYVDNDNIAVAKTAVETLQKYGHQRIAFVCPNLQELVYRERYSGYKLGLEQAGLDCNLICCLEDPFSVEKFISKLTTKEITAIVAGDDVVAIKLMPFLANNGLDVGNDLSLIGINNSIFATLFHPYLTTIDIHVNDLGKQSAKLIVEVLKDNALPATSYIISHEVVIRETVTKIKRS